MIHSEDINGPVQQIPRERAPCALCGADDARIKYTIDMLNTKLSRLWLDGVEHRIESLETIVECPHCGLAYANPRLAAGSAYTAYTPDMELAYFVQTRAGRRRAYNQLLKRIPSWLGSTPATLLDIGCGDGLLIELARRRGIYSVGTEASTHLVQRVQSEIGADAIVEQDLDRLPAAHYDVITLLNVIEHVRAPQAMLRASARLLKPGGILAVHTPNWGGLPARIAGPRWHQIEPFGHFYYFTNQTLGRMLSQNGLTPFDRFNLVVAGGIKARMQELLGKVGIFVDNGLGVVARNDGGKLIGR